MPFGLMPSDTGGSKFAANIADNAGVNQAAPTAGVNRRTQNAEVVSDASVYLTTTGGAGGTIGDTTDAAVVGNTAGSLSAKARGLNTTLGTTTDAAVYDDVADATVQARLRGAVDHLGGLIATTGTTADAAVSTDAVGTISGKLRGLIVLLVNLLSRWPAALTAGGNLKAAILEAIPAGTNNIGDVDVLTLPNVTIGAAIPAGTNNIGDVDVLTLPNITIGAAIPAGTNNIGDVDVLTLPAITFGAALPAGANNIGDVDVLTLPALPAGTNNIGDVDIVTMPAVTVTGVALDATLAAQSAKLPATLGQKAMAASLAVVLPSDDGVYDTATHTVSAVAVTSAQVLVANSAARYRLLVNDSDTTIYLKLGAAAVINQGIRLNALGGAYEMTKQAGNLYTFGVYAIHAGSGAKTLLITEGT